MPYRSAVPLAICLVVSSGCAGALHRSVEAYQRGDFRAAHELLGRVEPGEGEEVRAAVAGGIDYSTSYLLSQAWVALERGRGAKPYREALAYYRAALAVMPSDHPRRAATLESVAGLERDMEEVRERHRATVTRFAAIAEARDYAGAVEVLGELVELMRSVGADRPRSGEVLALAGDAMGDDEHELAVQLVELADLVRREAQARVDDEDMGEIARVAAALRYFRRADAPEEGNGKASVRRPTRRKPEPRPVEPPASTEAGGAEREARSQLRRARAQWEEGNKYQALRTLDDAIAMLGFGAGLGAQRDRWQPARELLIADYVERGELALSREASAEARGWYERILALEPAHELAHDRLRKLDKLQELQSGSGNR